MAQTAEHENWIDLGKRMPGEPGA